MSRFFSVLCVVCALALCGALPVVGQDVDPPVIEVLESGSSLVDGSLFKRSVTPVIQVTDASPTTVDSQLDGLAFVSGTTVTGEGLHELVVTATDDATNSSNVTIGFEIDTVPPVFGAILPVSGTLTAAAEVTLTGQAVGATSVTVDGAAVSLVGEDFTAGPYTLTEGERTWALVATDAAGNTAQTTHRVVRDSTPPSISVDQPLAGTVRKASPVDVVGTVSDLHLESVTVDGTAASLTGSTFLSANVPLGEGATVVVAEATDAAGNVAQTTRTVELDTQAPGLAITDPAAGTVLPDATITVSGTATDPHLDRVEVNGVAATLAAGVWTGSATLVEGGNTIQVEAFDRLGWSTTASVSVVRDSQAPAIAITQPADGAYLQGSGVDVAGTVGNEAGLTVTVNGVTATVDTTPTPATFSATGVPLVEGENRLIARVTDSLGNQGAHTLLVYRDTLAPTLVRVEPGDGALAIPPTTVFHLTFSEDLGTLSAGAWTLETDAALPITADATASGAVLSITPQAALPSKTGLVLTLTAGIVDRAGNALASPPTLTFTTLDVEAPAAPVLGTQPPGYLCASTVALSGTAEGESVVGVTGGAGGGSTRAAADGSFALSVELLPGRLNRLELTATDQDGNTSAPLTVEVVQDCEAPVVVGAAVEAGAVTVSFSEAVDAATVTQAGAVTLSGSTGALAGTVTVTGDGLVAVFTPDAALPAEPIRLDVTRVVQDLAGNPLAFPYAEIFGGTVTTSFVSGRVLDAGTGRPLAGATVVVDSTDGAVYPDPQPQATTGDDGRFRIPVAPGTHAVLVLGSGSTPVFRTVISAAGQGGDTFDPRLTAAVAAQTVPTTGGTFSGANGLALAVPAGALAVDVGVAVTELEEQALPALLPYGWSPRGAAWVDLAGEALSAAATLTLPVDSPDGTSLAFVRLDLATLQWHVEAIETVLNGAVSGPVAEESAYAAVEADTGTLAPPAAVTGTVLGSSPAPAGDEVASATVSFDPTVVLPSQRSEATVGYTLGAGVTEVPSGLPLTLSVQEELTLLDGTVRTEPPYEADLVLYHSGTGAPQSRFGLTPSALAQSVALQLGAEDVVVRPYAGQTVMGNVLGPAGGTVSTPEGDRVDLAAGALPEPTAVLLDRRAEADLPVAVPAGTVFLGAVDLDLSGRTLSLAATLTLELGAAPGVGEEGLLFEVTDPGTGWAFRPVAALAATATGWTTATIDPVDLPWPGVRSEGLYVFARLTTPVGYLRGTVYDVGGAPLAGALVTGATTTDPVAWIQLSAEDGTYVLPTPVDAVTAVATDLTTGDQGAGVGTITVADERVDLALFLQVTGPEVLSVNPADGSVDVTSGIEPTVTFSEAVDPTTVANGIFLYDGSDLVPATVEVQGALVRVRPQATLRPGAAHELRVTTAVKDLQGNRVANAVSSTFTTLVVTSNENLDLTRVHLFEPDAFGMARVLGRDGAVPAGSLVFIENLSRLVSTPSVTADAAGGFDTTVEAALTDRLLLHVVITGQNEVVIELTPFLETDGRGAHVAAVEEAVTFTTLDGITVEIEPDTFLQETVVRVVPQSLNTPLPPRPASFQVAYVYDLDFGGAEALKPVQISLPLPAGLIGDEGPYLLSRTEEILGASYWMVYDLMRFDGTHLTTEPAPSTQTGAQAASTLVPTSEDSSDGPSTLAARSENRLASKGTLPPDGWKAYLPGSAFPGQYMINYTSEIIGFAAIPVPYVGGYAYFTNSQVEGLIAKVDAGVKRLLAFDAILMPTLEGTTFTVEGRNLSTGYKFFEATYDPPTPGEILLLPADNFGDKEAPVPVAGTPVRIFPLAVTRTETIELDTEIEAMIDVDGGAPSLTLQGSLGAAGQDLQVRLLGLDDTVDLTTRSQGESGEVPGDFTLTTPVVPGNRYLIAVGAVIATDQSLRLEFSEGLPSSFAGIEVLDAAGRDAKPQVEALGSSETVEITLETGWQAGTKYTLKLAPELADTAGNTWDRTLELELRVAATGELPTYTLPEAREVARLGSLLFVAGGADGLVVLDASNPAGLASYVQDGTGALYFPLPFGDPVQGVAVDPHGRVLVVGGGINSPGQMRIFDPLDLDLAAIAAARGDPTVRYTAFNGTTILADSSTAELGGTGTTLPAGRPRRVAVVSDDLRDRWRIGVDLPPAGITVAPAEPPAEGGPYEVSVSGQVYLSDNSYGANRPVTLRDFDRGRWNRVDTDASGLFTVTLTVEAGDTVELLRNRESLAYVATLGFGVQVVDVNAFYNEDPASDPNQSDMLGVYTGYQDPTLDLCDSGGSDIGGATLDVGVLLEDLPPHQITVVGLVGLRGLIFIDSPVSDVGDLSRFGDLCLTVGGARNVQGLEVLEDYIFDLDHDGRLEEDEARDYLLVAHRTRGILILDASNRDYVHLVSWIELPGGAAHLGVDREARRVYAAGAGAGVYVVNLGDPLSVTKVDKNADGLDDRILETIPLNGGTLSPILLVPELGLAYAGGLDRGVTGLAVTGPRIVALAENAPDPVSGAPPATLWREIRRLAPLGVPTAIDPSAAGAGSSAKSAQDLPGTFRLLAHLPGVAGAPGSEIKLDLVSVGPLGVEIGGAGDPATLPDLPPTSLAGTDGVILHRLSDNPLDEGYQIYLSEEIAPLADLRAASAFTRTTTEEEKCTRCDVPEGARELLSGDRIAVRFSDALRTQLEPIYGSVRLAEAEIELESVRWEMSPSVRQEPTLNPSMGTGDVVPGTLLHSGELSHGVTDLMVKSRGFDFAFTRTYRNQTVGTGPLGPGWDLSFHKRLRELPNGDVEYYDGRGRRELFEEIEGKPGTYDSPAGRFVSLSKTSAGWVWVGSHKDQMRWDRFGRLVAIADAVRDSDGTGGTEPTGNEMRFTYDLAGRLVRVTDTLDRDYVLSYDAEGRLSKLEDFDGREVTYDYDLEGRLASVTSPAVTVGEATFPDGLTTTYGYTTPAGSLPAQLTTRDNLTSITDARGIEWLGLTYTDASGDGRADEVTQQTWGGDALSIAYGFGARSAAVTDRRGNVWRYLHNADGQALSMTDPSGAATVREYFTNPDVRHANGILTRELLPSGREIVHQPREGEPNPRAWGLAQWSKVVPDSRGANGSNAELVRESENFQSSTTLPTLIRDARGVRTFIARDGGGRPTTIIGAYSVESVDGSVPPTASSATMIVYNNHGQPTEVTNPNGHLTAFDYFADGESEGYLQRQTADQGGLGLVTEYRTDARGNVTAVTDPRGVRHEFVYNELDWLVEERLATTSSDNGAPALNLVVKYLYDEVGNLIEERQPVGDGSASTRTVRTYGALGEVLEVRTEISPGGVWAIEGLTYDKNRNVTEIMAPEGEITRLTYDERNLLASRTLGADTVDASTESYTYTPNGELASTTDGRGNVWQTSYDGYGRLAETIDPLGNRTTISYDSGGNPTEQKHLDSGGVLLAQTGATFDGLGRPVEETAWLWQTPVGGDPPPQDPPGGSPEVTTERTYDPGSNLLTVTDPLGRVTSLTYDGAERLKESLDPAGNRTVFHRDGAGNVLIASAHEVTPGGGTVQVSDLFEYDALGRQVAATDGAGNRAQLFVDARGNVIAEVDPEGNLTEHRYDGLDREIRTTRPGGISVDYTYDRSSRPVNLTDALGNLTQWAYDTLGRMTSVTYPDATVERYTYDPNGNRTGIDDPRGVSVTQTFDLANRLTGRSFVLPAGVEGPSSESFAYDGLSRVTQATSGTVTTNRAYDSLSRLVSDQTLGRAVGFGYDAAGNLTSLSYPSGRVVSVTPDSLDRPERVDWDLGGGTTDQKAVYEYRGLGLVTKKTLGYQVAGTMTFDGARRLTGSSYTDVPGSPLFGESISWSARSLKTAQLRTDLNGAGFGFTYDPAGRLTQAARVGGEDPGSPLSRSFAALPEHFGFSYDAAENLLTKTNSRACESDQTSLLLDGSGRNRPGAMGATALAWDAAGNLTAKGGRELVYDANHRLTRVLAPDTTELARYEYDAFGRRVRQVVGGETIETVWAHWQPIEELRDGQLVQRRTYGLGLDEMVTLETDLDGDGVLDQEYLPFYDSTGSLVLLTDAAGKPIERYEYSPFGERFILVDSTPPGVEQIRVSNGLILVELSEEVLLDEVGEAITGGSLTLTDRTDPLLPVDIALTASQPVLTGRQAGRRLVLTPDEAPEDGADLELVIPATALRDLFGNVAGTGATEQVTWPAAGGDLLVHDDVAPEIEQVCVTSGGILEVSLSEPPDLAAASALFQLDGATVTWSLDADGYTLRTTGAVTAGVHTLSAGTGAPLDLAGLGLSAPWSETFTVSATAPETLVYSTPYPGLSAASTVGNAFGFHGLQHAAVTGFVYARNRYYDPELGRFIQTDPMGYVDGPNSYQYALNNPVNYSDPLGLFCPECNPHSSVFGNRRGELELTEGDKLVASVGIGMTPYAGEVYDYSQMVTGRDYITGEEFGIGGQVLAGVGLALPLVPAKVVRRIGAAVGAGGRYLWRKVGGPALGEGLDAAGRFLRTWVRPGAGQLIVPKVGGGGTPARAARTIGELTEALKGYTLQGNRVAHGIESGTIRVNVLGDELFDTAYRLRGGIHDPSGVAGFALERRIYLRSSSSNLLGEVVHEGTHALDHVTGLAIGNRLLREKRARFFERQFQIASGGQVEFPNIRILLFRLNMGYFTR